MDTDDANRPPLSPVSTHSTHVGPLQTHVMGDIPVPVFKDDGVVSEEGNAGGPATPTTAGLSRRARRPSVASHVSLDHVRLLVFPVEKHLAIQKKV
jgi:hypothetical protein